PFLPGRIGGTVQQREGALPLGLAPPAARPELGEHGRLVLPDVLRRQPKGEHAARQQGRRIFAAPQWACRIGSLRLLPPAAARAYPDAPSAQQGGDDRALRAGKPGRQRTLPWRQYPNRRPLGFCAGPMTLIYIKSREI